MSNSDKYTVLAEKLNRLAISHKINEPLSLHSTFKVGGEAKLFVSPSTEDELAETIRLSKDLDLRTLVIGRGSNIVFSDCGFNGVIISTFSLNDCSIDGTEISAGAGIPLIELASTAAKHSLSGLEFSYGIPGSLGGAVFMNAGAYDGEMKNVVVKSRYYDVTADTFGEFKSNEHCFGYRDSIYRSHPEWVIVSAVMGLSIGDRATIEAKMKDFMSRRREKQPLEYPSAGSAFKRYPGRYTAQMIDEAGLKGYRIGGAQVSEKHAGFIINTGGATANDVRSLSDFIKQKLFELHGIEIESEIIFVE